MGKSVFYFQYHKFCFKLQLIILVLWWVLTPYLLRASEYSLYSATLYHLFVLFCIFKQA